MSDLLLVDVDGVVADLMGGFDAWLQQKHGERLPKELITRFHIPSSPSLKELGSRLDLDGALMNFLSEEDVYERYVDPIPGARAAFDELRINVDILFVTATLSEAPSSYVSKFRWCRKNFGDVPLAAVPSRYKHTVRGRWLIDDRWDTCGRAQGMGIQPLLFGQPWNEAPPEVVRHDWPSIVRHIREDFERWP